MSDWADLVTTALLGTGRRPLPATLPGPWGETVDRGASAPSAEVRLLDLAARHRAAVRAAPAAQAVPDELEPTRAATADAAPTPDRPAAPARAVGLLGELLVRPTPDLINCWLRRAGAVGCVAPATYWTRLARLAAHSTAYDRPALGLALGARGRWFLEQNPDWRRLAADCAESQQPRRSGPVGPAGRPTPEMIRGRPAVSFDHPDPWPDDVVAAAFAVVGSGSLGRRARDYAARVGGRLPLRCYATIAAAAEYYLQAPEATPAQRRLIKESFVIMERAAFSRLQIESVFEPDGAGAGTGELRRVEIPHV